MNPIAAKLQFLANVKRQYPALYRDALARQSSRPGLAGLGTTVEEMIAAQNAGTDFPDPLATSATSTASGAWYSNILNSTVDTIKQLLPVYVGQQQAKTCLQINADRAKAGLAPIDCASGGLAPQVAVGISPDVKTLAYVGLGLVAVFMFMTMKKRK